MILGIRVALIKGFLIRILRLSWDYGHQILDVITVQCVIGIRLVGKEVAQYLLFWDRAFLSDPTFRTWLLIHCRFFVWFICMKVLSNIVLDFFTVIVYPSIRQLIFNRSTWRSVNATTLDAQKLLLLLSAHIWKVLSIIGWWIICNLDWSEALIRMLLIWEMLNEWMCFVLFS